MSSASTRLLNIIKSTSESTNKVNSRIVTLEITSLSPLVFKYDKLIIDKDFYVSDKNFSTQDLSIGSKVKALMTNAGQTYYILANKSAGGGGGISAFGFDIDSRGHLILHYADGSEPPDMYINSSGHLIYEF